MIGEDHAVAGALRRQRQVPWSLRPAPPAAPAGGAACAPAARARPAPDSPAGPASAAPIRDWPRSPAGCAHRPAPATRRRAHPCRAGRPPPRPASRGRSAASSRRRPGHVGRVFPQRLLLHADAAEQRGRRRRTAAGSPRVAARSARPCAGRLAASRPATACSSPRCTAAPRGFSVASAARRPMRWLCMRWWPASVISSASTWRAASACCACQACQPAARAIASRLAVQRGAHPALAGGWRLARCARAAGRRARQRRAAPRCRGHPLHPPNRSCLRSLDVNPPCGVPGTRPARSPPALPTRGQPLPSHIGVRAGT